MHDGVQDNEAPAQPRPDERAATDGLLHDLGRLGRALPSLIGAQLSLFAAELGLARSAISWLLAAWLVATIAGVGLGLTLLGLIGLVLAKWFASWIWGFIALAVLEALCLCAAIWLFRRCMHWMSLPATRQAWRAMAQDTLRRTERKVDAGKGET